MSDIIKGQNLRIKVGGKYVAFATSCTVHVSNQLEDSSTKDTDDGMWQAQSIVSRSWDISVDALYSTSADATGINAEDALDLVLQDNVVTVEFTGAGGTKNRTETGNSYSGNALISDISVNAPNRQNASYTIQATGTGALTKSA